jgi:hypothetical protein
MVSDASIFNPLKPKLVLIFRNTVRTSKKILYRYKGKDVNALRYLVIIKYVSSLQLVLCYKERSKNAKMVWRES